MWENVDDSNLDGLRLILGHELVHRAQHVNHPQIIKRLEKLTQRIYLVFFDGKANLDLEQIMDTLIATRSIMTLIENLASAVQHTLNREHYPDAKIEFHWSLPVMLFRLVGAEKLSQYQDGVPMVMEAMERRAIDDLYQRVGSAIRNPENYMESANGVYDPGYHRTGSTISQAAC